MTKIPFSCLPFLVIAHAHFMWHFFLSSDLSLSPRDRIRLPVWVWDPNLHLKIKNPNFSISQSLSDSFPKYFSTNMKTEKNRYPQIRPPFYQVWVFFFFLFLYINVNFFICNLFILSWSTMSFFFVNPWNLNLIGFSVIRSTIWSNFGSVSYFDFNVMFS